MTFRDGLCVNVVPIGSENDDFSRHVDADGRDKRQHGGSRVPTLTWKASSSVNVQGLKEYDFAFGIPVSARNIYDHLFSSRILIAIASLDVIIRIANLINI